MAPVVRLPFHYAVLSGVDAGESIPWEEVVAQVHRQMLALAGPSPELDDLTQLALEQVIRSLERFRGDSDFATFTYRICVHVVLNRWRWWKRWMRRFEHGDGVESPDERPGPSDVSLQNERARHLRSCLDRLSPIKRLILTLSDLEDMPASRIADIVGCAEPTIRSRLRQARRELVELLARDPLFRDEEVP
jgi:RNA polymerase sigma-70 factor (ECF subfamily)